MAGIPDGTTKLTVSGTLAAGKESFACSFYFVGYTEYPATGSLLASGLDSSSPWSTFITAWCACMTTDDVITEYSVYYYSGGVAVSTQNQSVTHAGTVSTESHPKQIAAVLTLRTALSTRSGRGRVYIPATGVNVSSSSGACNTTQVSTCVDDLALFLSAIDSGGVHGVVVSQTMGVANKITQVDCDQVLDTQRRRRNRITSARHIHAVT